MRRFPIHGWAGLSLIAISWTLNWTLYGPRSHVFFFSLWLGYALVVDGIVVVRRGTSPFTRSLRKFCLLFALSAPAWWLFELFNWRTRNWQYLGAELFSDLEYAVFATIAFSTVMPAVFETAELVRSFSWTDGLGPGPVIRKSRSVLAGFFSTGVILVIAIAAFPTIFYPLMWASIFCLIEPLNVRMGRPSLFDWLERGDWRPAVSLALGALICGFFWEFWNVHSFPKWTYHTPGVNFWHVFEMPLLGYLGYLPFGLELLALGHLIRGEKLGVRL